MRSLDLPGPTRPAASDPPSAFPTATPAAAGDLEPATVPGPARPVPAPIVPPHKPDGDDVVSGRIYYVGLSLLCLGGIGIVHLLGGAPLAARWASAAMAVQAVLCLAVAINRLQEGLVLALLRSATVLGLGLLTGVSAYYFGPHSGFAGVVALLTLMAGLLAARSDGGGVFPPIVMGILTYLGLAGGQLLLFVLVLTGVIADLSLTPVIVQGHPLWHDVAAHVGLQAIYLTALLVGQALQRRYDRLSSDLESAERESSLHQALVAEARQDYRRAVALGRQGIMSGRTVGLVRLGRVLERSGKDEIYEGIDAGGTLGTVRVRHGQGDAGIDVKTLTPPATRAAVAPPPTAPSPDAPTVRSPSEDEAWSAPAAPASVARGWQDAYGHKMRGIYLGLTGACLAGMALIGVIGRERGPRAFAIICMVAGLLSIRLHRSMTERRADGTLHWPLALASIFTVGPAYALGLHSGISAFTCLILFLGGPFRAAQRSRWYDRHIVVLVAVCAAHAIVFALVALGVYGDDGNVPILVPADSRFTPLLSHILLQGTFVAAYACGSGIDQRYGTLLAQLEEATREAARQEALLVSARADVDRLLAHPEAGLFTDQCLGRYQVGRLLGRGGMGEVYQAAQPSSQNPVALKLIRRDCLDENNLRLFEMEAAALARVRSPYVARVLEAGGAEEELPYLVMEYIEGRSLAAILRERGRLDLTEVCGLVHDISLGLAHAHEAGVLHGDVKPQNIMLTRSPTGERWKLVDFGVARVQQVGSASDTLVAGTPQYMSPEQARGERLDTRSDLYSLSLVIYRALTGRPTFIRHYDRVVGPPDPSYYVTVSPDLELVLRLGLASQPEDRFASTRALGEAFATAADGHLAESVRALGRKLLDREPWASARETDLEDAV